ncbi:MAG: cobalt-precorrin-6A reductase [Acetobacteraceae bacterium]|nr:cobalt-precorrin-6A reductase [Acetobacteraceae bacterium]
MNILLLGGTTEASALARTLAGQPWQATLSLAGRTREPVPQPIPCRVGGFGGVAGLAAYLRENRVDALVDATHPFAAQMIRHAAAAAAETGTPLLRIDRPAWTPREGAVWHRVATMQEAADALGLAPRRVLLTVGQKDLGPFTAAPQHAYVVRSIDPPAAPPPGALVLTARGPFLEADERALLQEHRIEVMVSKNAGGTATAAKLAAATDLGVPVVMVERPVLPAGLATVATAAEAFDWLARHAGTLRRE